MLLLVQVRVCRLGTFCEPVMPWIDAAGRAVSRRSNNWPGLQSIDGGNRLSAKGSWYLSQPLWLLMHLLHAWRITEILYVALHVVHVTMDHQEVPRHLAAHPL